MCWFMECYGVYLILSCIEYFLCGFVLTHIKPLHISVPKIFCYKYYRYSPSLRRTITFVLSDRGLVTVRQQIHFFENLLVVYLLLNK